MVLVVERTWTEVVVSDRWKVVCRLCISVGDRQQSFQLRVDSVLNLIVIHVRLLRVLQVHLRTTQRHTISQAIYTPSTSETRNTLKPLPAHHLELN